MSSSDLIEINLTRSSSAESWGFRLQGGSDFSIPLSVQLVNPHSVAEKCGLITGDAVLRINNRPSDEMEHEEAKKEIISSGNRVILHIQRGSIKIWKPKVTPLSELKPAEMRMLPEGGLDTNHYLQKTSLAADKQEIVHIGTGYNRTAKPFGFSSTSQYNTDNGLSTEKNMNSFNQSDANLYSSNTQDDKPRTKIEEDSSRDFQGNEESSTTSKQSRSFKMLEKGLAGENEQENGYQSNEKSSTMPIGIHSVKAPVFDPNHPREMQQSQHMTCKVCSRLVIGVFVKIQGEPMHPECFKCHSCGKNLKNEGYFKIGNQLYCEQHAKEISQAANPDCTAMPVYR